MELSIFMKGLIAGLVVCAPVGPIGLLCVRRTLVYGRMVGLVSLWGASTADGLYCFIAGFGVAYISNFLRNEQRLFTVLGGLVLMALGIRLFFSRPDSRAADSTTKGSMDAYVSGFLLMLANPLLILVFTAVLTSLEIHGLKEDCIPILTMVAGVLTGSALWAPILVMTVNYFGRRVGPAQIVVLNRVSGGIIFFFGVGAGLMALMK